METAIHYLVKAKLIRNSTVNDSDLVEFTEVFYNDNPIKARENAFRHYQNFIDVLIDATGHIYRSDKQARELLTSFMHPKATIDTVQGISSSVGSLGYGIGVFLVIDCPLYKYHKEGDKYLIHGIGNFIDGADSPESLILGLETEYDYYMQHSYGTNHNESSVVFCDSDEWEEGYREDEPVTYTILETPFDWEGMDIPYWWAEASGR